MNVPELIGITAGNRILIGQKELLRLNYEEGSKGIKDETSTLKREIFEVFIVKVYGGIQEIIKSTLLALTFLAIYKVTGLNTLWIQLVGKIISIP